MPGLSNYRPIKPEDYDESTFIPMPPNPGFGYSDVQQDYPDIYTNMQKRYQDSLGFADPARSAGDSLFHQLYENTPKGELDKPVQMIGEGGRAYDPTSIREILEILKGMSPLNTLQGGQ